MSSSPRAHGAGSDSLGLWRLPRFAGFADAVSDDSSQRDVLILGLIAMERAPDALPSGRGRHA